MSRSLLLLRHAEAQAAGTALADFDRILTPRGRDQARDAARRIMAANLRPEMLLASPAARTRETAEIVALELGLGGVGRILLPADLYLAEVPVLLSVLKGCDDAAQTLLLIGHNPGVSALACELAGTRPAGDPDAVLELGLGALCHLTVAASSWRALEPGTVDSVKPI
jgi:phosphohistidine phosphatase